MRTSYKRGFTLIELLVVIAIIGILASIVLASLDSARKKGRDARRISDLKQIQLALELYYDAQGQYPASISGTTLTTPGYISVLPSDPSGSAAANSGAYFYSGIGASSCTSYHLGAVLETAGHSALSSDADAAAGTACGSGTAFDGTSASCGSATAATESNCYDLKP